MRKEHLYKSIYIRFGCVLLLLMSRVSSSSISNPSTVFLQVLPCPPLAISNLFLAQKISIKNTGGAESILLVMVQHCSRLFSRVIHAQGLELCVI